MPLSFKNFYDNNRCFFTLCLTIFLTTLLLTGCDERSGMQHTDQTLQEEMLRINKKTTQSLEDLNNNIDQLKKMVNQLNLELKERSSESLVRSNKPKVVSKIETSVNLNNKEYENEDKAEKRTIDTSNMETTDSNLKKEPSQFNGKMIVGAEEWVWFDALNNAFKARIDTGATTSSFSAKNLEYFERDGKKWVRFQVDPNLSHLIESKDQKEETKDAENTLSKIVTFELPIVRWVKIRQASADESQRRPIVEVWIRIGTLHQKAEFTLTDRSKMTFPVLLGREFFRDLMLVDVARTYIYSKPIKEKVLLDNEDNQNNKNGDHKNAQ